MIEIIKLKNIKPNPFNARTDYKEEPIKELAKEIDAVGFWSTALRGRLNDGKVELCFGHRRLEALKRLHRAEVAVDIVELSDEQMMEQGLIENLQRQGLNDLEKAEGIRRLVEFKSQQGMSKEAAYRELANKLGYKEPGSVKNLTEITESTASVKNLVAERKISAKAAIAAERLGGPEMVKTAAREELSQHAIEKLSQALENIPDEKVKKKIKAKVIVGEITTPKEIEKKAEPMLHAKREKGKPPPDLLIVVARWTHSIRDWRKALKEVIPYRNYLDTNPRIAKEFREEVQNLIEQLQKLL